MAGGRKRQDHLPKLFVILLFLLRKNLSVPKPLPYIWRGKDLIERLFVVTGIGCHWMADLISEHGFIAQKAVTSIFMLQAIDVKIRFWFLKLKDILEDR